MRFDQGGSCLRSALSVPPGQKRVPVIFASGGVSQEVGHLLPGVPSSLQSRDRFSVLMKLGSLVCGSCPLDEIFDSS